MVSLDTLDDQQKDKLTQYQSVTQIQDVEEALGQLLEHDWNLEKAIQDVYENNKNDNNEKRRELEEQVASSENNMISPQPPASAPPLQNHGFLLSILLWPFGMAWSIICSILSFASGIFLNRSTTNREEKRRDPRVLSYEFIKIFEEKYGQNHIEFFKGGYSQALEKARKDLRFLLVILQSDDQDDTAKFNRDTLTSQAFIDYTTKQNMLIWAGNVYESEAHKVSYALNATTYPFLALIALQGQQTPPKMTVIERMEGYYHPMELSSQIEAAIQRHGAIMNKLKHQRQQRELERQLLKDQDRAYHQSLLADQEKERLLKLEQEKLKQVVLAKELHQQQRNQYLQYLVSTVKKDENADGTAVAKLSFRLSNGDRIVRQFNQDATVEHVYQYIQVYSLLSDNQETQEQVKEPPIDYIHKYDFTIHSTYPRIEYHFNDTTKLIDIKSLWPSATLVVEDNDDE